MSRKKTWGTCRTCGDPEPRPLTFGRCDSCRTLLAMSGAKPTKEMVNHPSHYGGDVEHEVYKCLHDWGLESDAFLWTAVTYIARCYKKGSTIEDLKKAIWYINKRIEYLEKENAKH